MALRHPAGGGGDPAGWERAGRGARRADGHAAGRQGLHYRAGAAVGHFTGCQQARRRGHYPGSYPRRQRRALTAAAPEPSQFSSGQRGRQVLCHAQPALLAPLEHSHQCRANAILGTRCRNVSPIRRWPVLGAGNNVERARGVANGGQAC